jgi:hypothetical protein
MQAGGGAVPRGRTILIGFGQVEVRPIWKFAFLNVSRYRTL